MRNSLAIIVHRGNSRLPVRQVDPIRSVVPPVADVYESGDAYILKVDIPGATRESIAATVTDEMLTIAAESVRRPADVGAVVHREIVWNAYSRSFNLGRDIDIASVAAEFADGVLTVILPKHSASRPRTIAIN